MKETWDTQSNEELCIEYQQTKSNELFEYFLSRNLGLILDYFSSFIIKHPEQKDDYIQIGQIAIWRAMLKFNPTKVAKFTTYMYYFFRDMAWHYKHVNLPTHVPINHMNHLTELKEKVPYAVFDVDSLDTPINEDGDDSKNTLEDLIASDEPSMLEILSDEDEVNSILRIARENLTPKQFNCLIQYFGLDGKGPKTLQIVANQYHVSRERIRQILVKAIKKLKRVLYKQNDSGNFD